jgi:phosphodiesterase/alkaline phosphatase D-like protein
VEYGETPELGDEQGDGRPVESHAVTLSGLEPASTYYYRVSGDGGASKVTSFRTAPEASYPSFSFAVIGESGSGSPEQREVAGCLSAWDRI